MDRRVVIGLAVAGVVLAVVVAAVVFGPRGASSGGSSGSDPLDPAGGALHLEYEALPANGVQPLEADLLVIADILRRRLETLGVSSPSVVVADHRIVVEVPSIVDGRAVRRVVGPTGRIDFVPLGTEQVEEGGVLDLRTHPPLFGGDQIASASVGEDDAGGFATVDFTLRPQAATVFAEYTKAHIGEYFAITLDARVLSAPVIMSGIDGGQVQISSGGLPDPVATRELAAILDAGSLPWPLREVGSGPVPAPS